MFGNKVVPGKSLRKAARLSSLWGPPPIEPFVVLWRYPDGIDNNTNNSNW